MSDKIIDDDDPRKADAAIILAFFQSVGASLKCPMCESEKWGMLGDEISTAAVVSVPRRRGTGDLTFYNTIALVCDRCGFVRHHVRAVLESGIGTGLNKPDLAGEELK